ncbi:MAG: 1-deoxy-D-xylulose-5-phosphate reductoisomerase [Candidatus Marinimicrobia bacterium]|nr:1-deoxy-D-xylulose-5-phosphate reductoisomerase [Candidatus Neomarinimicrobiota bacterium]
MKTIGLLGSTGSIGKNVLRVIDTHPERFSIAYMTANTQVDVLIEQAKTYMPHTVIIGDEKKYDVLCKGLSGTGITCAAGYTAIVNISRDIEVDVILNAIVGIAGMQPTIAAVKKGRDVALSNKESLVMAGTLINNICAETGAKIFPVDSEHSAIWQCLTGESESNVEKIILTGSGGPFLRRELSTFDMIRPEEALKHPNWSMGAKITIDSATMINKGLELIEAYHLFHLDASRIDIMIHPESIIHSMVQFNDGSIKAQLGIPDMKVPIQYALSYPEHLPSNWPRLDLTEIATLHFEQPDNTRFPSLALARQVLKQGETYPAVFNVANEQAVYRFLNGEISFPEITASVKRALDDHQPLDPLSLEDILKISKIRMN